MSRLALALSWSIAALGQHAQANEVCDLHFANGVQIQEMPVARTKAEKQHGLAGREEVGPGLLFVFDPPENAAFWMRDTRIALSVAFVSQAGEVFLIEDMEPENDDYHLSMRPVSYALELPLGAFKEKGVAVGSQLQEITCRETK